MGATKACLYQVSLTLKDIVVPISKVIDIYHSNPYGPLSSLTMSERSLLAGSNGSLLIAYKDHYGNPASHDSRSPAVLVTGTSEQNRNAEWTLHSIQIIPDRNEHTIHRVLFSVSRSGFYRISSRLEPHLVGTSEVFEVLPSYVSERVSYVQRINNTGAQVGE